MNRTDIKSMDLEELTEYIKSQGLPQFRAKQLYEWMHVKLAASFEEMSNIPLKLRRELEEKCELTVLEKVRVQVSEEDGTAKYLFMLSPLENKVLFSLS